MRNVKNAYQKVNYWQIDHKIKNILGSKDIIVLPSPDAWLKFKWTKKYFEKKPKEGYFIWVKKEGNFPLTTCLNIASPKISQNLNNLLVIEQGIKVKVNAVCNVKKNNLCAVHKAQGKLILKKGSFLEYNHIHQWGRKDLVKTNYEFILKEGSNLIYNFQDLIPPEKLSLKTAVFEEKNSCSNLNIVLNGLNTKMDLSEALFLNGENAQGIIRLRLVGRKNSQIKAKSSIVAKAPAKGHLDCQGLLVDNSAKICLIPELICENKKTQITHEASIGKISEDELNYLRMRGLSEKQAIDLIINGFLRIK